MGIAKLTGARARIAGGLIPFIKRIRISAAPDGSNQNSAFTLPSNAVVLGAYVDVRVAEVQGTGKLLDVGPSSDPNGYLAAIDVSSTGLKKGTLDSGGQTLGALLRVDEGGTGELVPEGDVSAGGEVVQFTASNNDWVEFRGDIYIVYLNLSAN